MSASEDWQVMHEVGNDTQEGQSESRKSDKFYDETGDVEIVSSDGTIYKIHSYYLQASSKFFRDMIQIGSSSKPAEPIELNENQKTLDAFFDIVINHNHMKTLRISLARDVYGFLKEYECIREIDLCRYQLNIEVSGSDETPFYVFIKAAMLEDHELCARALSKCTCRPWQSKGPKKHRFGAALRRGSLLDLRTAPRDILDLIPMDSLWTLMRASRIAEDAERSSTSSDDESDSDSSSSSSSSSDHQPNGYSIGREYLRLMTLRDNPPKKKTKIA